MDLLSRKAALVLTLLSAALFFSALGSFPLTDRDEGEYAASVSEMIRSGDYIVPRLNGRPYLEKPILFFWTLAASFNTLGQNEVAARLPSALAAFLLILSMLSLHRILSCRSGLFVLSGLVLVSNPLFLLVARACLTDMLLTLFIWLSMVAFFLYMEKNHLLKCLALSSLFLGLGFLTKGPVAVAMCLPVFLLYSFIKRDFSWLRSTRASLVLVIFLTTNIPWYFAMYERTGSNFLETFFYTQNLERFFDTLLGHGGGPLFYPLVLALGLFPYSSFMPRLVKRDFLSVKTAFNGTRLGGEEGFVVFCVLAYFWIFILLSVAATKQINYIIPLLPFLSISIGALLLETRNWPPLMSRTVLYTVAGLILSFSIMLIFGTGLIWSNLLSIIRFDSTEYAFPFNPPWQLSAWGAALFLLTTISICLFVSRGEGAAKRSMAALLFSGFLVILFLPGMCNLFQLPAKDMAVKVGLILRRDNTKPAEANLVSFGLWKPSMIFYAKRKVKRIKTKHPERLEKVLSYSHACFVFSRVRLREQLKNIKGFFPIYESRGYLLGGNRQALLLFRKRQRQRL